MLEAKIPPKPPLTKEEFDELRRREHDIALALDEFFTSDTMPLDVAGMRHNDIPHHVLVDFLMMYRLGYPSDKEESQEYKRRLRNLFPQYFR